MQEHLLEKFGLFTVIFIALIVLDFVVRAIIRFVRLRINSYRERREEAAAANEMYERFR